MTPQATSSAPANGANSAHELFSLTDEAILEIEPAETVEQPILTVPAHNDGKDNATQRSDRSGASTQSQATEKPAQALRGSGQAGLPVLPAEPPAWLAAQMKDPWAGAEARELWEGVQRAQTEAAEYKQVFEKPEAARAAAERAQALDEFDAAYFGAAGKSAEETSAARVALAQRMMQEDPEAFREMVSAGIKALEKLNVAPPFRAASAVPRSTEQEDAGLKPGATQILLGAGGEQHAHLAAYSEFEKAANADLEKSVGATIERALQQALPNAGRSDSDGLKVRLATGVRQEIEKALQGDRQLGEQVAQVLSARRFDETARAQVVRLINDRAQQLVPSATKRVLNDWTQTTLAAHRSKAEKQETTSSRADLAPAQQQGREPAAARSQQRTAGRADAPPASRGRIDYKKLSDEQILDM